MVGELGNRRPKLDILLENWKGIGFIIFVTSFYLVSNNAPLRNVFYVFVLIPGLLGFVYEKREPVDFAKGHLAAALAFSSYIALTALWGNRGDFLYAALAVLYIFVWLNLCIRSSGISTINTERLLNVIVIVGTLNALLSVWQFYYVGDNEFTRRLEGIGVSENPTVAAQYYGIPVLIAWTYLTSGKIAFDRIKWLIPILVCIFAMICTQGRGALLAILATLGLSIVINTKKVLATITFLSVISLFFLFLIFTGDSDYFMQRGTSFRIDIWKQVIQSSLANVIFGNGLNYSAGVTLDDIGMRFNHAHNSWIATLYTGGLIGLLLAFAHLWFTLKNLKHENSVQTAVSLWFVFGCLCLLTNGNGLVGRPDLQWLMYWVPVGLIMATFERKGIVDE